METHRAGHLDKMNRIKKGAFYTPPELVDKVYEYIEPYLRSHKKTVIFDSSGGCGAFLSKTGNHSYRIADIDSAACNFLREKYDSKYIYNCNTLIGTDRKLFNISSKDFLIMVGNPPYNDTTSEFKSGQKGKNVADPDLFDRDMGISFLKSYGKLKADVVCILHPLSYLIKKANFERLKQFKTNYKMEHAVIFSSAIFEGTGSGKFPIIIGLYVRNNKGMDYEYIRNFNFEVLDRKFGFRLSDYQTTDGYINKYPARKNDLKISPVGIYYYTFRDFNTLRRNASFIPSPRPNAIVVTTEELYKYAYLFALKQNFHFEDDWILGNLSPLMKTEDVEANKALFVKYALAENSVLKNIPEDKIEDIKKFYKINGNKNECETSIKAVDIIKKFAISISGMNL